MVKTYIVKKGQKPTEEQIRAIKESKKHPITFDKDCEELSPAMQKAFRCAVLRETEEYMKKGHDINLYFRHHHCMMPKKIDKFHNCDNMRV